MHLFIDNFDKIGAKIKYFFLSFVSIKTKCYLMVKAPFKQFMRALLKIAYKINNIAIFNIANKLNLIADQSLIYLKDKDIILDNKEDGEYSHVFFC